MNNTPHRPSAPAPLGIWPCDPAPGEDEHLPELAEHVTPELLRQVLAAYSRPGDTIALIGIDPAAQPTTSHGRDFDIATAATAGPHAPDTPPRPRRGAGGDHSGEQPATIGLLVAALPDPARCDPDSYRIWRQRLRPGGVLVALTACPAGAVTFANNAGIVVTSATAAGLVYHQHIVAIHARIANDQLLVPPGRPAAHGPGTPAQRPVHSDVLVFVKPGPTGTEDTSGGAR